APLARGRLRPPPGQAGRPRRPRAAAGGAALGVARLSARVRLLSRGPSSLLGPSPRGPSKLLGLRGSAPPRLPTLPLPPPQTVLRVSLHGCLILVTPSRGRGRWEGGPTRCGRAAWRKSWARSYWSSSAAAPSTSQC